jgi:hypothetical protein
MATNDIRNRLQAGSYNRKHTLSNAALEPVAGFGRVLGEHSDRIEGERA